MFSKRYGLAVLVSNQTSFLSEHSHKSSSRSSYKPFEKLANSCVATLQVPYLLSLAGLVADFLPSFPFDEGPTSRIVDKLDRAFATLLSPHRVTAASIASVESERFVSITDRVRIRSIIEGTRIVAVEAATKGNVSSEGQDASEDLTDTDHEDAAYTEGMPHDGDVVDMGISRLYERSLSLLGDSLG
jgi:Subunit 11 of the general transcription factor TFIIH